MSLLKIRMNGLTLLRFFFTLLIFTLISPFAVFAQQFTATSLGDHGNVSVLQVAGSYDAHLPDGSFNSQARKAITNEFYKTHQDELDFIVIFSNFNYEMLQTGTAAFYTPVKNDTLGIGLPWPNEAGSYGSRTTGRLQGLIDMGNIASLESDPLLPGFEKTLMILTHEQMHRWGANVKFLDPATGMTSNAILSSDGMHWNFFLDSNSSALYGNHWRDNGDGNFTSIAPEYPIEGIANSRLYSPLDLYLMGIYDRTQVPPMLLIKDPVIIEDPQPEISPKVFPQIGVTVRGTPTFVTIDQIIAAEGERVPSAAVSPKAFKTAFILITNTNTFSSADLRGIEAIRSAWITRYSILTDGKAMMNVGPCPFDNSLPTNPGVPPPVVTPRTAPFSLDDGVSWLTSRQQADGHWEDLSLTGLRDTAESLITLKNFSAARQNYLNGLTWLASASAGNTDYLSRAIHTLADAGQDVAAFVDSLVSQQNADGGWGSKKNFMSNPVDTGLALKSLAVAGCSNTSVIAQALDYLKAHQNADGGWSAALDLESSLLSTADILSVLNAYRNTYQLEDQINLGSSWLIQKQNADGGFGYGSTFYETAVSVLVLMDSGAAPAIISSGLTYLRNGQSGSGSWNESTYQTALSVRALLKGQNLLPPAVGFTIASSGGDESAALVKLQVSLSGVWGQTVTVEYSVNSLSTATNSADYSLIPGTLTFNPGETTKFIDISVIDDAVSEPDETIIVDLTNPVNATLGTSRHTYTIIDNDIGVTIKSPVDGGIYAETTPSLLYQVSKSASVVVKVDGVVVNKVSGNRLDALTNGEHKVRVEATDASGNAGVAEVAFVVSTAGETAYKIDQTTLSSTYGGAAGIATDKADNVYVIGQTSGPSYNVEKYDSSLVNRLWVKGVYGSSSGRTYPQHIAVNSEGSFYESVYTANSLDGNTPKGSNDAYLLKYDTDGTYIPSAIQMATTYTDEAFGVAVDKDDNIYVCGLTGGSLFESNYGYWYLFVAKYDKQRNFKWGRQVSTRSNTSFSPNLHCDAAVDGNGSVYAMALTDGDTDGYTLVKYDSNGIMQWLKPSGVHSGSTSGSTFAYGVAADALGNIYVAGSTSSGLDGNTSAGVEDIFVVKYNSIGAREWTKQWGSSSIDGAYDIVAEGNGTFYVTGFTGGSLAGSVGSGHIFVRKCDTNGNILWTEQMGTTNSFDSGYGLAFGSNGSLYVAGVTGSFSPQLIMYKLHDTRLPAATLDHDTMWTNTESRTITGTMTAGAQVQVTVDTGALSGVVTYPTSTTWQCTINGLVDGTNNVTVTAKNSGGFRYTISGTITRDSVAPTVSITSPWNWQTYYDKPVLEYTVSDGSVKVKINGVEVYKQSGHTLDSLSSGENTIRVEATDQAGNIGFAEVTIIAQGNAVGELPYGALSPNQFGTTGAETVTDLTYDSAGNLYITGYTSGNLEGKTNHGQTDVFVVKYDSQGNKFPAWLIGTTDYEYGNGIAVDKSGNVYLVWTTKYVTLKNGSTNYTDIKVAKYNGAGTQQWVQTLTSKSSDYAADITVDASGNVFIVGYTDASLDRQAYGGNHDFFVVKYNNSGRKQWTKESNMLSADYAYGVALDAQGNIYVTGQTGDTLNNETSTNSPFIIKYNTSGVQQWGHILDSQKTGAGKGIVVDGAGNIYVTGHFDTGDEPFAAKYDNAGNRKWIEPMSAGAGAYPQGVAVDSGGNVYATGYASGAFDGNAYFGATDIFLVKFDNNGQKKWSQQYGTSADDEAMGIVIDSNNNVWLTGNTSGMLGQSSSGGSDLFLMKLVSQAAP